MVIHRWDNSNFFQSDLIILHESITIWIPKTVSYPHTAGATGQQRMLTPSRHLPLLLVFPGVHVNLIFNVVYFIYLICALILTVDFSLHLAWLTDFDCGFFRLPNFDTLNLSTDIWNGAHRGRDRSAEDAYSSVTPDPTFAFVGGPCCPTLDFVFAFCITITFYTLLTSLFCILDTIVCIQIHMPKIEFQNDWKHRYWYL
jgi:hypothetical protein